jgi:hypothetical protein
MMISKAVTPFLRLSNRSTVWIWFMAGLSKICSHVWQNHHGFCVLAAAKIGFCDRMSAQTATQQTHPKQASKQ